MKRFFQILMILNVVALITMSGCKDMDHSYKEFIQDGETIYIGKADSVVVRGGDQRVEVSWLLLSDPKVESYKIFWNNRRDSLENTVTKTDNVDTVRVLLNDMPETTHHFEIIMIDKYGDSSVPTRASGRVYGPRYKSSLLNRTFRGMKRLNKDDLEIDWAASENTLIGVEVEYVDKNGVDVEHMVSNLVEKDILYDFPENGEFRYRSLFLPDTLALDTFYSPYSTAQVDDALLRGLNTSFTTETQYGAQDDQLSIMMSTDFSGIYEVDAVNAATWVDITDKFDLATGNVRTPWGPINLAEGNEDESVYIAFRYNYDPDMGTGRTWRIRSFEVRTNGGDVVMDQAEAQFQLVTDGVYEEGRSSISNTLITLRGNRADTESPKVEWAISRALQ